MNLMRLNGVNVYNLTAHNALPDWASRAEKRNRTKKQSQHVQVIQELEMPDSSTYLTTSPDERYLFVLGRYKPRVRCYELSNLSMKFDRCVDYLPYKMSVLSDDYSKFALLQEDRWIDIHAAGGHFFRFRIPRPGVDMSYCSSRCNLLIAGSKKSIYRLNLHEGRFDTSLESSTLEGSNFGFTTCVHSDDQDLTLAGSSMGRVDGWDVRVGRQVFGLNLRTNAPKPEEIQESHRKYLKVSSLTYKDALNIAVGTNEGMVYIYDLRQNKKPWHTRDTEYRRPVKTITFHEDKVIAMVANCVKLWYIDTGKIFVGFDSGPAGLNWLHHFNNSGLIMIANEAPKVSTYLVPLLGHAPSWCGHLDQMVTECEPDVTAMYDGYKFMTRQQLAQYGMDDLIGSQFLRAYMHGYFVATKLFEKIRQRLDIKLNEAAEPVAKTRKLAEPEATAKPATTAEELEEVSADVRFSKLMKNSKLSFNPNSEANDLMSIHQTRLLKKRRRKEVRKVKAQRAQNIVKGSTGGGEDNDEFD